MVFFQGYMGGMEKRQVLNLYLLIPKSGFLSATLQTPQGSEINKKIQSIKNIEENITEYLSQFWGK